MTDLDHRIRALIAAHLSRHGVSARRFGQMALGDPGFVASLDGGRRLRLDTADRVLAALGEPPVGPAFAREVEAFLGAGGGKPYVLGEQAAGDASFVARLRAGGTFMLETVAAGWRRRRTRPVWRRCAGRWRWRRCWRRRAENRRERRP